MAQVAASPSPNGTTGAVQKLPLFTLTAMVVGSMVGSGIFSLPRAFGHASVMSLIPFFLVALYGFLLVRRGQTYDTRPEERTRDLMIAGIAVIYTAFLIFAAGMKFLVLSGVLYGPGTVLYFWTRREQSKTMFTPVTRAISL